MSLVVVMVVMVVVVVGGTWAFRLAGGTKYRESRRTRDVLAALLDDGSVSFPRWREARALFGSPGGPGPKPSCSAVAEAGV